MYLYCLIIKSNQIKSNQIKSNETLTDKLALKIEIRFVYVGTFSKTRY